MHGSGRPVAALASALALVAVGCGGGRGDETTAAVPCNDAAFRAQDEELYVTRTATSNASGGGAPAIVLLDLQRARKALGDYLAAHPPCDADLVGIAATEQTAIGELDAAVDALESRENAESHLAKAFAALRSAQRALTSGK
jgi:hypothetical protein